MAWTTYNTGTTTAVSTTWTTSGTSTDKIKIYNGGKDQLQFKKGASLRGPATKRDVRVKKGFWDGVEWKEHTSYFPRKSITGKIIIGKMHKRWRSPPIEHRGPNGIGNFTQYAKTKELFEEKLRGKA